MKILHIADLHIRALSRHSEYKVVFETIAKEAREKQIDYIFIGGDLFHTKTSGISPEYMDFLPWMLKLLGDIAPVHIILGNHDGNLQNSSRQDAVSPIVSTLNHPNVFLYKKSGIYKLKPGYNLCVFSLFDEDGWKDVSPTPGEFNIACYHGSVYGCILDNGMEYHEGLKLEYFKEYDIVLLGDIHKMQYLDYRSYELEIDESELKNYPDAEVIA